MTRLSSRPPCPSLPPAALAAGPDPLAFGDRYRALAQPPVPVSPSDRRDTRASRRLGHHRSATRLRYGHDSQDLQIVHSAFFGLQRQLSNPVQAVEVLGFDILQAIILKAQVFTSAEVHAPYAEVLQALWLHSLALATCARELMAAEGGGAADLDEAYAAGLLHDVVTLVMIHHLPDLYDQSRQLIATHKLSVCSAERDVLGVTHAQVGAYLMGLWGLSDAIIDALNYHHQPSACPIQTWSPLAAVHIAEALLHELMPTIAKGAAPALDTDYLHTLGLWDHLPIWREHAQQALLQSLSATEGRQLSPFHDEVASHV